MNNKPILFLDSGIGGLLYCSDFQNKNPDEEVCHIADRKNFPYGPRTKEELSSILILLTEELMLKFNPKIIVLACNTATVSAIESLRKHFPEIPFVGTVPAIKPALFASKNGKIGILGTARTIEDPYNQNLVKDNITQDENKYKIFSAAAPELVEFIEQKIDKADEKEKSEMVKKYMDFFREKGVDTLVLGCTHFLYLLEEFKNEAAPSIVIFDSLDGITKRIEFLLDEKNGCLRAAGNSCPSNKIIITGNREPDSIWINRAQALGYKLNLLCDV